VTSLSPNSIPATPADQVVWTGRSAAKTITW
jgi:hypothetical protein